MCVCTYIDYPVLMLIGFDDHVYVGLRHVVGCASPPLMCQFMAKIVALTGPK